MFPFPVVMKRLSNTEPTFWFDVVRVGINKATGIQDISLSQPWTPKAARYIINNQVYGASSEDVILAASVGHTDGTTQNCAVLRDGATTYYTDRVASIGGSYAVVKHSSFSPGKVSVNITANTIPGAYSLTILAFGGTALSAKVGRQALAVQDASATANPGFRPNVIFADWHLANTVNAYFNTGIASHDGTTTRQSSFCHRTLASSNDVDGNVRNDAIATWVGARYLELSTFTDTSFDIVSRGADLSGGYLSYLALNFGGAAEAYVATADSPTATGSFSFTGPSFTPSMLYSIPSMVQSLATDLTVGEPGAFGISVATSDFSAMNFWRKRDGAAGQGSRAGSVAFNLDDHTGVDQFDATLTGFSSGNATFNFTAANGTARKWPVLFIK